MRAFVRATCAIVLSTGLATSAGAADRLHRIALQISDNAPQKMTEVLNIAANVSRYYSGIGDRVDVVIVAFAGGLNMLRPDKSPVAKRIRSFARGMPNVTFEACRNTMDTMERKEGKPVVLFEGVKIVPSGVVELVDRSEKGYTVVRP